MAWQTREQQAAQCSWCEEGVMWKEGDEAKQEAQEQLRGLWTLPCRQRWVTEGQESVNVAV